MEVMHSKRLLWAGLTGSAVAAICCFTPILVMLFGVLGLGAITGYLDYVLLPALAFFVGLTVYAVTRQRPRADGACCAVHEPKDLGR